MRESGLCWLAVFCLVIAPLYAGFQLIDKRRRAHPSRVFSEKRDASCFQGWRAWAVRAGYPAFITGTAMYTGAGAWFFLVATKRAVWKFDLADVVVAAAVGLLGLALSSCGLRFHNLGRRARAISADDLLASDPRLLVLYLRSFRDDPPMARRVRTGTEGSMDISVQSCEEQVADVLGEFGPVVAIGRPKELLPELGAARIYVEDDRWQAVVESYMKRAGLVVFLPGSTAGIWWEIRRAAELLPCQKVLFLISVGFDYDDFRQEAEQIFRASLPAALPAPPKQAPPGNLAGVLFFDRDGRAHFQPMCSKLLRLLGHPPVWAGLKLTLRPVFEQQGVPWAPPPFSLFVYLFGLGCSLAAAGVVAVLVYVHFFR
jgi:hypothetical protein